MIYRREIDGLRALAVLPVILFHGGFQTFSGGFVGVDIFFVISGYLITSIILAEIAQGQFSIVAFYERRARRILPALFFVILVCLPFAWAWLYPKDLKRFTDSILGVVFFISNHLFSNQSNYFDTAAELKPLLHTWSLAVEEQYYLLFPPLLCLTWKLGYRWVIGVLIVLIIGSLGLAQWGSIAKPAANFYLLPSRAWELLTGSLIAFYLVRSPHIDYRIQQIASLVGLGLITYAILYFDHQTPFPSLFTLTPVLGTTLIIIFATPHTWVGRILSTRPLVGIGLISYSAYLWHQPLFAFARYRSIEAPSSTLLGFLALISLVLAYFSWKYVETPFRNKSRYSRKKIFTLAALASIVLIIISIASNLNKGFEQRLNEPIRSFIQELDIPKINNGWCFYSVDSISTLKVGDQGMNCWLGDTQSPKKALLFGDSFAGHYEPTWHITGLNHQISIHVLTTNWCHPSLNDDFNGPKSSRAFEQCRLNRNYLKNHLKDYDLIIYSANWSAILSPQFIEGFKEAFALSQNHAPLTVLMASPKIYAFNFLQRFQQKILFSSGNEMLIDSTTDVSATLANQILRDLSKKSSKSIYIDRDTLFHNSDYTQHKIPFSLDGAHISIHGAKAAGVNLSDSEVMKTINMRLQQNK